MCNFVTVVTEYFTELEQLSSNTFGLYEKDAVKKDLGFCRLG